MTEEKILEVIRMGRNSALDAAIELCEEFARTGGDASSCVRALKDLKAMMAQVNDVKVN